jgi:hypothetical protein
MLKARAALSGRKLVIGRASAPQEGADHVMCR